MKIAPIIHAIKKSQENSEAVAYRFIYTAQPYLEKVNKTLKPTDYI